MPYLYAIEMQIPDYPFNPIKIGFSKSPEFRFTQFTCGPFPIVFLGKWRASKGQFSESLIHTMFERYRLVGEWFYPADELLAFIQKRIKTEPQMRADKNRLRKFKENYAGLASAEPVINGFLYNALNRECDSVATTQPTTT